MGRKRSVEEWDLILEENRDKTGVELAAELEVSPSTVTLQRRRRGLGTWRAVRSWKCRTEEEWDRILENSDHIDGATIAAKHGVTLMAVAYQRRKRGRSRSTVIKERNARWVEMYKRMSGHQIADLHGVNPSTVYHALKLEGVEIRGKHDAPKAAGTLNRVHELELERLRSLSAS